MRSPIVEGQVDVPRFRGVVVVFREGVTESRRDAIHKERAVSRLGRSNLFRSDWVILAEVGDEKLRRKFWVSWRESTAYLHVEDVFNKLSETAQLEIVTLELGRRKIDPRILSLGEKSSFESVRAKATVKRE